MLTFYCCISQKKKKKKNFLLLLLLRNNSFVFQSTSIGGCKFPQLLFQQPIWQKVAISRVGFYFSISFLPIVAQDVKKRIYYFIHKYLMMCEREERFIIFYGVVILFNCVGLYYFIVLYVKIKTEILCELLNRTIKQIK